MSALCTGCLYPQETFLVLISLSRPQGHSAAGRVVSMKNSNDTIGNRTRDLPACSVVPQPTVLPHAPSLYYITNHNQATRIIKMKWNRSLNTTNGLLAKMESSYVTTRFSLFLWPSSGYNLVALRVYTVCLKVGS